MSTVTSAALLGPSPYLSSGDSPFSGETFSWFYLEDFEDQQLNTPGLSVNQGIIYKGPSGDSVDIDNGVINGNGGNATSIYDPTSMTFTFDTNILGGFPTRAGLVWTDGTPNSLVDFEAFDQNGASLGVLTATLGDYSFNGTTAEDRFLGVSNAGGISKIFISDRGSVNNIEVDHIQYGLAIVPLPASAWLLISGLIGLFGIRKNRNQM
ncbi:MAG: VPLPA-CTERM sorting domain-containing protein [Gammaproteobacteria bacterium]|nr:VPLPA-CTERM sorting domain-containing protein [Gammaproteobacteria bacterium]